MTDIIHRLTNEQVRFMRDHGSDPNRLLLGKSEVFDLILWMKQLMPTAECPRADKIQYMGMIVIELPDTTFLSCALV